MRIITATLVKQHTDDGLIVIEGLIGEEYLVDLDSIESSNPGFQGPSEGVLAGARDCIQTVCPDCRGYYVGKVPLELLKLQAEA